NIVVSIQSDFEEEIDNDNTSNLEIDSIETALKTASKHLNAEQYSLTTVALETAFKHLNAGRFGMSTVGICVTERVLEDNNQKNFPENNYDHNDDLVEVTYVDSLECQSRTSRWLLSSRTCILDLTGVHPETKALFASEDWTEIVNNFEQEVKLSQTDIPKIVIHFFDEVNLVFEGNLKFYLMILFLLNHVFADC
ncbi:1783_t:CDS:2, partial [Funneliformis geosporum]